MSRKRPRDDEGWWQQAVDWVQSHPEGKVHPEVKVSDQRELSVEQAQEEGTELLRIPFACLVSEATIKSTTFGQQIVVTIQNVKSGGLYSPAQDLAVAFYLAKYPSREEIALSVAAAETKFRPYLDTLPERSSHDGLPRLWPEDDLKLLGGSPLLERVREQKNGILKDYELIYQKWEEIGQGEDTFPAFEDFSYRLAAVSSRAFAGFGSLVAADTKQSVDNDNEDMNIAMVPILDLCNHCRGKSETKNLSYKRGPAGEVVVTASQKIQTGENLRITYGARSNAQLLLNYGFCIPFNIEPDGSSNDFLEFSIQENKKTVELRAGPKAHSFHGFVNALDSFAAPLSKGQQKEGDEEEEGDDFDANEKEFDQWDMDMMGDMGMGGEEDEEEDDEGDDEEAMKQEKEQAIARYLAALTLLETRLKEVWGSYHLKGKELQDALSSPATANQRNAALLIQSEHRAMFFVLCVIGRLRQQLSLLGKANQGEASTKDDAADDEPLTIVTTKADKKLLLEQANEVSSAFMAIRLPG